MRAAFAKAAEGALFPRLAKGEREAITAYYQKRDFAPLWHADGAPTKAALALLDRLAHAGEEGLDPDDYAAAATPAASKDAGIWGKRNGASRPRSFPMRAMRAARGSCRPTFPA